MLRRTLCRRMMQLHAQPTPNPLCHSFSIPADSFESFVPQGQSCEVAHRGLAWVHPLSQGLFEQYPQEVMCVFIAPRHVSISVYTNVDWSTIEWSISSFLGHYLIFNNACVSPAKEYTLIEDDLEVKDNDSEVLQCIKELLREQVRPMVQRDGGDVKLLNFNEKTGIVSLAMLGACRTCPSSQNTLKEGIERVMKHFLPEVTEVIEAKEHQFYEDYGLLLDSEKALFKEAARLDRERKEHIQPKLTPTVLSYDALSEPDGD
ncbi:putative Scaffold protein Nfu/NifU N terminal/NifU-like domain containing protein [Leishmania naiffi]|uniref:Scaffold protein Nfu/NifU N terminal/NifU-like domain containing protein n=1 Tax=Leishmania naiffi TaxID=5678 RepID=A0AAW3B1X6_9TRYP